LFFILIFRYSGVASEGIFYIASRDKQQKQQQQQQQQQKERKIDELIAIL
jgi:hypothetical protein